MTDTDPVAGTPLTARAGFLISQLGFCAGARFTERLAPLGLQPRHFGLLTHLAVGEGQTQQQLADKMGIHRNVMVGLADDLERRGLVHRDRHPDDRRAYALYLTDAARDVLTQAQRAADDHDTELLAALVEPDRARLIELLQRIAAHTGLTPGVHPDLR
ncbi:MAG: MarR family transcriptional regulator [Dermatophilaceae bacterium]